MNRINADATALSGPYDACHAGVVLRAVLLVLATLAVATLFGAMGWLDWLTRLGALTLGALPATLLWLLAVCALKGRLALLPTPGQVAAGVVLGALAGVCAWLTLSSSGWLGGPLGWVDALASAGAGALLAALLVAGLLWRARAAVPAATSARLAELQSRIKPHFLFNALNSAIALVREDPARAETVLENLSDLIRRALADPDAVSSLGQEVDLARRYLAIEQVRFGERLRVQWALDAEADDARVPPLLLQPLVENAVRHAVEVSDEGSIVRISVRKRSDRVVIKVTNTVPRSAATARPGQGMALANLRERLWLLHDVKARFETAERNGIYQARLELPA